jgi:hypothetical protein
VPGSGGNERCFFRYSGHYLEQVSIYDITVRLPASLHDCCCNGPEAIGEGGNPEAATAAESDFKVEIRGFRGFISF